MSVREKGLAFTTKLATAWASIRGGLWFLPALCAAGSMALAAVTLALDATVAPEEFQPTVLLGGGASAARSVLDTIGGSIITVTGVVFSVTIIALQLASSQFTPRVLRNFTADRGNQLVLGVFIGTFTYTLVVQRSVRGENGDVAAFVPTISVTVAVLLALLSVGFLIYFVDHVSRWIQAPHLIDRAAEDAKRLAQHRFPVDFGDPLDIKNRDSLIPSARPDPILADRAGYLQVVDEDALFGLAREHEATVRMEVWIGQFILPGTVIAQVWPARTDDGPIADGVRSAFVLGGMRNARQDLELMIIELVDIAVKALSPSINDPTTATNAIDRLGEILAEIGQQDPVALWRTDRDRKILFLARSIGFDHLADLTFNQLRHYGAGSPVILEQLLNTLGRIRSTVRSDARPALDRHVRAVLRASRRTIPDPASQVPIRRARDRVRSAMRVGEGLSAAD